MEMKTIVFKFDGPNVTMKAFGKDFISLLSNVYQLVEACSDDAPGIACIENNCITIKVVCAAAAVLALSGRGTVRDVGKYNAATKAISSCMRSHGATLEYSDGEAATIHQFGCDQGLPSVADERRSVQSVLTIYGELLDVGGSNPNAHIQSDAFEDVVKLDIDRETAKKLAARLYEQVGIRANVLIRDGKVVSGKALEVLDYEPQAIDEWLKANEGRLGGESFKGVDVNEFIVEQRV